MNILLVSSRPLEDRESSGKTTRKSPVKNYPLDNASTYVNNNSGKNCQSSHCTPEPLLTISPASVASDPHTDTEDSLHCCLIHANSDNAADQNYATPCTPEHIPTISPAEIAPEASTDSSVHCYLVHTNSDTPDSALSSADTFSSYSGSSTGGTCETFVVSFDGLPENCGISENEDEEDRDSAVQVGDCCLDESESLSGSLASSHDQCDDSSVGNGSADIPVENIAGCKTSEESSIVLAPDRSSSCDVPRRRHSHRGSRSTVNGGVKSTTALILENRPSGLPMKSFEEEMKHRKMYEALVKNAKHKERKAEEQRRKQLEKQWRHEEAISNSLQIWNKEILPAWDAVKNSKRVKDLWWHGLPPSIRGKVWKLTIANDLNITSELYEICLVRATERLRLMKESTASSDNDSLASFSAESAASRESSVDVIKLDVSRTFPHLGIFQRGGPYHDLLQGLLGAYACYRPDVGYVQGMSFIAAVLLLNMDVNDAFVCFTNLLNRPCQIAFFRLDESLMKAYFNTYEEFFHENSPKLYVHFKNQNLTPDLYLIDWIFTLYAKSLSLDVTSRIWDVFFRDGEEFLFRTAIGILKLFEPELLQLDFIQLAEFLTRLPADLSADRLFRSIDSVSLSASKRSFAEVLAICVGCAAGSIGSR